MARIIEVRPIKKEKWHGLPPEKDFARPFILEALLDPVTHRYATGLNDEVDEKGKIIPNKDRLRLEQITGYDLSDNFSASEPHPFWSSATARVKLEHRTNLFDLDNPLHEILYHMMKASKYIANSQVDYENGLYPDAKFVIYNEREEVALKAQLVDIKAQVYKLLGELDTKQKADIITIVEDTSIKNQSPQYIDVRFDSLLSKVGYKRMLELLKKDKARNAMQAMIVEAANKRILTKRGNLYLYFDENLGDIESTVDFLLDPKNQLIKVQILEKLNTLSK